ncbi:MAG TPA: DNA-processing protein DprA [Longimicrobiaceae bacterium]|nr:DNA-processing protein DprA [Longimicrobiaceae bacterium]
MPLSPTALRPLLRLGLAPGVGPARLALLLRQFGSAERVLAAPERDVAALPRIGPAVARAIARHAGAVGEPAADRALAALDRVGAVALTPDDLAYPDAFRVLADPPYLLFAAGSLDLLAAPAVALVGTRSPTPYGAGTAAALAAGLAGAGYAVVSGMARGIDTAAHAAALDAGGGTIGVLGHGIDQVYPPENRALFGRVASDGLLLTEYVPGEGPRAGNFPRRNRLIAALSRAVVVVEMGLKSGAQHTVTYALEQGREVMAVPGPIGSPVSEGTNQLIKDGARVVTSLGDILEELQGVGSAERPPRPARPASRPEPQPDLPLLTPGQDRVLRALADEPLHVDDLCARVSLDAPAALAVLLELELMGAVESLPGKRYRKSNVDSRVENGE